MIKAQEEAAAVIRQARRNAEEIISELKEQFSEHNSRERQQAIEHARQKLRASNTEINGLAITDQAAGAELSAEALKPGMTVYVTTVKQKGEVLAVNGTDVTVQLGVLKLTVAVSACRLLAESGKPKNQPVTKHVSMVRTDSVARQIDIRGMTIEEAEVLLDKYIDDAVLSGLNEVLIIHGKGTGALRKGVKSYLENHSHIKGIRIADLNEGGTGATVARLA